MGKYLLVLAAVGVCIYQYMDLPGEMQATPAPQYEMVQLRHPLMPPSDSDSVVQDKDQALLDASPVRTE